MLYQQYGPVRIGRLLSSIWTEGIFPTILGRRNPEDNNINLSSPPIKADPSSTGRRPVLTSWKRTEWGGDRERWGVRLAMGLKNKREGKLNYPTPTTPTTPTTPPIHTTPTPIHPTRR
ncbi:hypothetical protein J3Q64DRAFT_1853349 [Phycomyces blakesleeanus]|uniref:Uncharacterized protein n=2 Tax=Phycomyces blakesleeanus TaxID=4837 RepID=A0A162PXZ5_PHYB8|nr:hypothetical protein PHYBLDRAFT_142541 [Phycomyces blakesleeanus NRRL 1555(-)]XP_018295069.1 hypothetical protein PHYBLDRAFT_142543 [Phycomyces blakesleeanus NRRL 1555(-)]OAD77027.1 hypothetical protein PHYBLDRAFT_142541 [Phycomyces blakesleeanus NRRL 1555(-)]OAD77029.1 hypothetical protein PHYBLDRAFT_142543 [Phycomyces blakesleeanus NRRL 1555(-)]|eukprot:XP_018295067.1 hypothetical protein PHYBLDRAFT_142541 [Phycomyces blakesleeanus NRRL 1555(-)]